MTVTPERRGKALEAARRIVAAHDALEKAKQENHPSFKEAARAMAYYELNAAAREGALVIAKYLLSSPSERERAAQIAESSTDVTTEASARKIATRIREAP